MALRSHCNPKINSSVPITTRKAPRGMSRSSAGPRTNTMAARHEAAAPTPNQALRQPRVTPTASTMVTASTTSTPLARKLDVSPTHQLVLMRFPPVVREGVNPPRQPDTDALGPWPLLKTAHRHRPRHHPPDVGCHLMLRVICEVGPCPRPATRPDPGAHGARHNRKKPTALALRHPPTGSPGGSGPSQAHEESPRGSDALSRDGQRQESASISQGSSVGRRWTAGVTT